MTSQGIRKSERDVFVSIVSRIGSPVKGIASIAAGKNKILPTRRGIFKESVLLAGLGA